MERLLNIKMPLKNTTICLLLRLVFTFNKMFYTAGIAISFFLSVLLVGKKHKTIADYLLSFWLCWIGLHLWFVYLALPQNISDFPALLGLSIPMPLLHPPMLYLYTATICRERLPRFWWLHFMPILACYLYQMPFMLLPDDQKIWIFQHEGAGYEGYMLMIFAAISLSGVGYIFFAQRLLYRHRKIIADLFSYQTNISLRWLQYLIYGMAGIWLAVLFGNDPLVFGLTVLLVLFIGYFGIRQGDIFSNPMALEIAVEADSPMDSPPDKKKYEKSGLSPELAEVLHQRLQELMITQQLFKKSELSLTELADRLGTHPNYLSQIINEKTGKNFYDYVNTMRVEAFIKMAVDPQNRQYTLLALAYECGFNSKSAFNRFFKKEMGQSPSEYINK
jgi:AraC-like DNA-binding protein